MSENDKKKFVQIEGYAPEVPKHESPTLADDYTLVLMIRDALQNGRNATRGNLAFAELVKRMKIELPKMKLDPLPYVRPDGERTEHAKGTWPEEIEDPDGIEAPTPHPEAGKPWVAEFKPRYDYSQDSSEYNPGPGAMGWYDDPDGSGKERWWMGIMWADTYRDKKPGKGVNAR